MIVDYENPIRFKIRSKKISELLKFGNQKKLIILTTYVLF